MIIFAYFSQISALHVNFPPKNRPPLLLFMHCCSNCCFKSIVPGKVLNPSVKFSTCPWQIRSSPPPTGSCNHNRIVLEVILNSFNNASKEWPNINKAYIFKIIFIIVIWIFLTLYENMHTYIRIAQKTQYYEIIVIECCISVNMNLLQSLSWFWIFIPICHVLAV